MTDNQATPPSATSKSPIYKRDTVVIGTSAGGVEALKELVSYFPADFPAAILIVIHIPTNATSVLPWILTRAGRLPAAHAVDKELLKPGHIYVGPPNNHMFVVNQRIILQDGPRVNGVRPAIDPLFQSAAQSRGSRVIGAILSGTLDDGVAGLAAIKARDGITIVQEPKTALFEGLPLNAINKANPDYILPLDQMARVLTELVTEAQTEEELDPDPEQPETESKEVTSDIRSFEEDDAETLKRTVLTCPECGGTLWEYRGDKVVQFRCHVGHIYSEEAMYAEQGETLESALWTALRAIRERAILANRMAVRSKEQGRIQSEAYFSQQARHYENSAKMLRSLLASQPGPKDKRQTEPAPGKHGSSNEPWERGEQIS